VGCEGWKRETAEKSQRGEERRSTGVCSRTPNRQMTTVSYSAVKVQELHFMQNGGNA
jgi:sensor c-di-GMP phosphodiesterase-like protein